MTTAPLRRSSRRRIAPASEARVLPLALALIARSLFAPLARRAEVRPRRSHAQRRRAARLSGHRAPPLALALVARQRFAQLARRADVPLRRTRAGRCLAARLSAHPAPPFCRAPLSCAPFASRSDRFLARETMASFAWNIRDLHCYSVCFAALKNSHLVRNLVRVVFAVFAAAKAKRREVAAHESFRLAGPTGLEPATSGVTGRSANRLTNCTSSPRIDAREAGAVLGLTSSVQG